MTDQQAKPDVNLDEVIQKYLDLRNETVRIQKEADARIDPLKAAMKTIETYMMKVFNSTGQTKTGTAAGVAFVVHKTGCNVADKLGFKEFILSDPNNWGLLTITANKTAVGEYIAEHGKPPPGINWVVMKDVQIRKS